MYNLDNVNKDFPWTVVTYNAIEPWREPGSNWFNELPQGWGDITHQYLVQMDKILKQYGLEKYIIIEQVKEKFGSGRLYCNFINPAEDFREWISQEIEGIEIFNELVREWEYAVEEVCCDCGTTKNVKCYGGWIHFACPECEKKFREHLKNY